jgi:serine/threonine protein kinase
MNRIDDVIFGELGFKDCEMIGIGVFGRVYKGVEVKSNNIYCIKIIPFDKFKEEEYQSSERTRGVVGSENLVLSLKMQKFEDKVVVALIMDFINGGDLKKYVDNYKGFFSPQEILEMTKQISMLFVV